MFFIFDIDFPVYEIRVAIRRIAVDKLPEEARQKQLHTQNHGQYSHKEERLLRNSTQRQPMRLLVEFGGDDPHRGRSAT